MSSMKGKVGLLWAGMGVDGSLGSGTFILSMLLASVFGGIHLVAWNFHFLSLLEMPLWRSTSLAITAIPLLTLLLLAVAHWMYVEDIVVYFAIAILPILYVTSRIVLLILPLVQLRSLPPDAFLVIPWSTFIPHI
jgi:hypothetical protein